MHRLLRQTTSPQQADVLPPPPRACSFVVFHARSITSRLRFERFSMICSEVKARHFTLNSVFEREASHQIPQPPRAHANLPLLALSLSLPSLLCSRLERRLAREPDAQGVLNERDNLLGAAVDDVRHLALRGRQLRLAQDAVGADDGAGGRADLVGDHAHKHLPRALQLVVHLRFRGLHRRRDDEAVREAAVRHVVADEDEEGAKEDENHGDDNVPGHRRDELADELGSRVHLLVGTRGFGRKSGW